MGTLNRLFGGTERRSTARGRRASAASVFVILVLSVRTKNHVSGAIVALIFSPAIWWACWGILGGVWEMWEGFVAGKSPSVSVGRAWQSSTVRKQLRQDGNARVFKDRGGIFWRERYWFTASGTPPLRLTEEEYLEGMETHEDDPYWIAGYRDRDFWWYRGGFYWTNNDEYTSQDIKALLFQRERQRQRELEHAHTVMAASSSPAIRKRAPIPKEVKRAVFERDEGRCVECGSDFDIQYDHIIPFSEGGASTVENFQILCARCNQQKGARL